VVEEERMRLGHCFRICGLSFFQWFDTDCLDGENGRVPLVTKGSILPQMGEEKKKTKREANAGLPGKWPLT